MTTTASTAITEKTRNFIEDLGSCFSTGDMAENNLAENLITAMGGEDKFINQYIDVLILGADNLVHGLYTRDEIMGFYKLNKNNLLAYAKDSGWDQGFETALELIVSHTENNGFEEDEVLAFLQQDVGSDLSSECAFAVASWLTWSALDTLCIDYSKHLRELRRDTQYFERHSG